MGGLIWECRHVRLDSVCVTQKLQLFVQFLAWCEIGLLFGSVLTGGLLARLNLILVRLMLGWFEGIRYWIVPGLNVDAAGIVWTLNVYLRELKAAICVYFCLILKRHVLDEHYGALVVNWLILDWDAENILGYQLALSFLCLASALQYLLSIASDSWLLYRAWL